MFLSFPFDNLIKWTLGATAKSHRKTVDERWIKMNTRRNKKILSHPGFRTRIQRQYREMVHEGFSEPLLMAVMLALGLIMVLMVIKT
jgi:hypothetical protein